MIIFPYLKQLFSPLPTSFGRQGLFSTFLLLIHFSTLWQNCKTSFSMLISSSGNLSGLFLLVYFVFIFVLKIFLKELSICLVLCGLSITYPSFQLSTCHIIQGNLFGLSWVGSLFPRIHLYFPFLVYFLVMIEQILQWIPKRLCMQRHLLNQFPCLKMLLI